MLTPTSLIWPLPHQEEIETVPVLRALVEANKALAELKGRAATIPNQGILMMHEVCDLFFERMKFYA